MEVINKILYKIKSLKNYKHKGVRSSIIRPIRIIGKQYISIGDKICIRNGARIEAIDRWNGVQYLPSIVIEDNVTAQQNLHLTCANKVHISKGVSIFPDVVITDIEHVYEPDKSISNTSIKVGCVRIGEFTTIGAGARIFGYKGITIGTGCVIGANAIVNSNIPDYTMVVGVPAKPIKRYNKQTKSWDSIE